MKYAAIILFSLMTQQVSAQWLMDANRTNHDVFQGANCAAWTDKGTYTVKSSAKELPADLARIEVIANADSTGDFKEPVVELVIAKGALIPEAFAATVKGTSATFTLDRMFIDAAAQKMVFMARLEDRAKLIESLKDLSQLEVTLMVKTKAVASLVMSLKGSTKAITQQFSDCKLGFPVYNPL